MRILLVLVPILAFGPLPSSVAAQSPKAQVLEVVERLFTGMRGADTTVMRSTFHPDMRLVTTATREGGPVATVVPIDRWLAGVAESEQLLDERIYEPEIQVADNLATVWTYYTFHAGGRFSHCGYNAFQLVLTEGGWKIVHVADTRQTDGCMIPSPSP